MHNMERPAALTCRTFVGTAEPDTTPSPVGHQHARQTDAALPTNSKRQCIGMPSRSHWHWPPVEPSTPLVVAVQIADSAAKCQQQVVATSIDILRWTSLIEQHEGHIVKHDLQQHLH